MSYLNPTRVHFAGQFRADVSTVNNDDRHFNSAAFTPTDIEKALLKIDEVASNQEGIAAEEALILRG